MVEPSRLRAVVRSWKKGLVVGVLAAAPVAPAIASAGEPPQTAAFAALNPVTPLNAATFADPPQNDMPWARWNFPPASATIAGLEADIQDAYDHNVAGLEIGQGGVPTTDQLVAIYNKAQRARRHGQPEGRQRAPGRAVREHRPVRAPDARGVQDGGRTPARRSAAPSRARRRARSSPSRPSAAPPPRARRPASPTSTARRCIDLTSTLTGTNTSGYQGGTTAGTLNWTAPAAPAGAQWLVIVSRAIPMGTTPEPLSPQGTKQLTDAYDAYFAGPLGPLVKANKGDFFVDSHAGDPWGAPEELWSSNMRTEFQARAGYDILPLLPALFDIKMKTGTGPFFSFSDGSADRIRSDFNRIRSTLYTQNRIVPFQNWARAYNMKLRLQQEDGPATSIGDELETSACSTAPSTSR